MGKKILVIGHAFIVDTNREVWEKLSEKEGVSVDVLVPKSWKSNLIGDINTQKQKANSYRLIPSPVYFKGSGSFYFYHLFSLFKILLRNRYELIIINQETWSLSVFFFNIICLFTKNRNARKLLMIAQNIKKSKLRFLIPLEKFNSLFFDRILGCCSEIKDVLEWKGIKAKWGYLPLYYSSEHPDIREYKDSNKIRLGYIGRLSEEKGIKDLIDFYNQLDKNEFELICAGSGPLSDLVKTNATKYLGVLNHNEVSLFYNSVDIVIVPSKTTKSWKEQFGRVIVEAIAHGKIVMSSNSGAIPEVMGKLGLDYIFNEGDIDSMQKVLNSVCSDIEQGTVKTNIKRAQDLNHENFSQNAFLERIINYGF